MGLFRKKSSRKKVNRNASYQSIDLSKFELEGNDDDGLLLGTPATHYMDNHEDDECDDDVSPNMVMTSTSESHDYNSSNEFNNNQYRNQYDHDRSYEDDDEDDDNDEDGNEAPEATITDLPRFIHEIQNCHETYTKKPAKALRSLFALSEDEGFHEINRIRMAREANGQLVPVLLEFLSRCEPSSSEQYLALLVLNNLCIPKENKRLVAIDHKGAFVLSRLLCQYPNIPLICIILVNLTFCDALLRKQLVDDLHRQVQLVEALLYVLKVSTSSKKHPFNRPDSANNQNKLIEPRERLEELLHHERLSQQYDTDADANKTNVQDSSDLIDDGREEFNIMDIEYPETAKWTLCGIKNLTRPPYHDSNVAVSFLKCGILPIVLETLKVNRTQTQQVLNTTLSSIGQNSEFSEFIRNDPYTWDANSIQDTSLYILINLAMTPSAQPLLREQKTGKVVSLVARYSSSPISQSCNREEEKQKDLQCLKARMVLAYLYGSEGHFGQIKDSSTSHAQKEVNDFESELLIKGSEAVLLVELLANTLHCRGKPGTGGYNATTFNPKMVLFALRCLLTNKINVKTLYITCGVKLNALLFKTITFHSMQDSTKIDADAAEDACFSLYLLSNHGFMSPFLPPPNNGFPLYQVLHSYLQKSSCTPAGRHAATQLMMRVPYLHMEGSLYDDDEPLHLNQSDMILEDALLYAAQDVEITNQVIGSKPLDDIFGRPLTRRKGITTDDDGTNDVIRSDMRTSFNSALDAVQDFSYGSAISENFLSNDDVKIANNIAICANDGEAESYGHTWKWEDGEIREYELRTKLNSFRQRKVEHFKGLLKNVKNGGTNMVKPFEPISFFGFKCGSCATVLE